MIRLFFVVLLIALAGAPVASGDAVIRAPAGGLGDCDQDHLADGWGD